MWGVRLSVGFSSFLVMSFLGSYKNCQSENYCYLPPLGYNWCLICLRSFLISCGWNVFKVSRSLVLGSGRKMVHFNICPFLYAAQLRLGLGNLKKSSIAVSGGTIIKSQGPDQIVALQLHPFFFFPVPPAVLLDLHKQPLWLLSSCYFLPPSWFCFMDG
jgi:hypothetical protein